MKDPIKVKASNRTKTHFGVPPQPVNKPEEVVVVPVEEVQPVVEILTPKKRKWKFEVERDWEGLIKTVIVTEI